MDLTSACAVKVTRATRSRKTAATLTNVRKLTKLLVASMPFARTFQEATSARARRASTETPSISARNATALNASVSRLISSSAATASWLTARTATSARRALSAFPSPVVSVTALALKVSAHRVTVLVLILTNAWKIPTLVDTMPFVLTLKAPTLASVRQASMENLIKVCVLQLSVDVLLTASVDPTRSACSLASAFVRRRSSLKVEAAKIHVKDSRVESTRSAVQRTHRSACVKLVSREILSKAAPALTNVQTHLAPMEPNASTSKAVTSANVRTECLEILTKVGAFMKILRRRFNVHQTKAALRTFDAATVTALVRALMFFVVQMLSANQKITLDGAAAELDFTKDQMETAYRVRFVFE